MNNYVLVYAKPVNNFSQNTVLLVLKDKPEFQKGRFNLVGGKIEAGETPLEAAIRELKEESGLNPLSKELCVIMGKITGSWGEVHCVKIPVIFSKLNPRPEETEVVSWMDWPEVCNSPLLMPNLKTIIPMMMTGVMNWELEDEGVSGIDKRHSFQVLV